MRRSIADAYRYIWAWARKTRFRLIVWSIRKYHPEGLSYDPERRIYIFRWTKELDDQLCHLKEREG